MSSGRHRTFDTEQALEAAMHLFWQNGYPGTSMADLTQAMAINKPSLYAAFGNKEQLYMAALQQYISQHSFPALDYLFAPDQPLEQRLHAHLHAVAALFCDPNLPPGCMMANSTCEAAGDGIPQTAHGLISEINRTAQQRLSDFFAQEQAEGKISSQSSPSTLALYLMSINSGMAVLARNGATLAELDEMIDHVVATMI